MYYSGDMEGEGEGEGEGGGVTVEFFCVGGIFVW